MHGLREGQDLSYVSLDVFRIYTTSIIPGTRLSPPSHLVTRGPFKEISTFRTS